MTCGDMERFHGGQNETRALLDPGDKLGCAVHGGSIHNLQSALSPSLENSGCHESIAVLKIPGQKEG